MKNKNFVKTFESYVNEVSRKRWRDIESNVRDRGMTRFADRIRSHSSKYGTVQVENIEFVGQIRGYQTEEVSLNVTDIELVPLEGSQFKLTGKDSSWGSVGIYGNVTWDGKIRMFESERMPLLAADRTSARKLIELLESDGGVDVSQIDWRTFTNGYADFRDLYR